MKPTIQLVAQKAGVSMSTVSRVLNNHPAVLPETRARVLSVMQELDYTPNQLARGLSSNGFNNILIIFTRSSTQASDNPYFGSIISSIGMVAEQNDYDLILHSNDNEDNEIKKTISMINSKQIKGIVLLSNRINSKFLDVISGMDIPIVVIGKYNPAITAKNILFVDTDNYRDCHEIGDYLIRMGHTSIGCIHAPLTHYVALDRMQGLKDSLAEQKIEILEDCYVDGGNTVESAYMAALNLLCSNRRLTAIFATDDIKALGVYKAARSMNLRIPEDISVIGHNDFDFSSLLTPPLTTVRVPIHELGMISASKLFSMINFKKEESSQMLPTRLQLRNSVKNLNQQL
ncbi:MAG: LacI family DNA-binding transcriptional regulator [Lachnospiraceae bacterium]|nr:LacI family DNA-binding transcriptional regulator [Lachnospiraceae bacterium]